MNPLTQWFKDHQGRYSYKWSHYFDIYHKHFSRFRGKPVRILEIGVWQGGSLQMWKWYFGKKAKIVGMDIMPECADYAEDQVEIVIGDQKDRALLESLGKFDIIIDDGGHYMSQQATTFGKMYEDQLKPGGIYMVEDTHTSYIPEYIDMNTTFVNFCKQMIDYMHTHYAGQPYNNFSQTTDSISFYDSVIVFEKLKKPKKQPQMVETQIKVSEYNV